MKFVIAFALFFAGAYAYAECDPSEIDMVRYFKCVSISCSSGEVPQEYQDDDLGRTYMGDELAQTNELWTQSVSCNGDLQTIKATVTYPNLGGPCLNAEFNKPQKMTYTYKELPEGQH